MKPKTVAIATVGTVAAIALGYAIYFDQKRRNDPDFRKQLSTWQPMSIHLLLSLLLTSGALEREKKRSAKKAKQSAETVKQKVSETLEAGLEAVNKETYPTSVEEKEQFFMAQIAAGETLCSQGKRRKMRNGGEKKEIRRDRQTL